tara:strand:+ start:18276 stop:18437 length:162 start_codon:yes stop_codon:yes gene_type:complete
MRERIIAALGREPTLGECLAIAALRRLIVEVPLTAQFVNHKLINCLEETPSPD